MNGANAELFVERWRREKMLFEGLLSGDGKNAISIIKYGECDSKGYLWGIRKIKILNLSL